MELKYNIEGKELYNLINKLDKQMWKRNPFVFVYDFELVD